MKIIFLVPVHPLLTPGKPLPRWQMQMNWVRALERQGHQVRVAKYTPDERIRLGWGERILYNIRVIGKIGVIRRIDLIILSLGADVLLPITLRLIKWLTRAPLIVLSGVSPIKDGNPRERRMARYVDLVAANDDKHCQQWLDLGAKKAINLPISAVDTDLIYPRKVKKDIDVLFVGIITAERKDFLDKLKNLLPKNINLIVRERVWEEEYVQLLSRAKIVLNPIRPQMKKGANLRMFEAPAAGALLLGSYSNKKWLTPEKEAAVYKNEKDAVKKIIYYIKYDKERKRIAEAGRKRVMGEHRFEDRARELIRVIGEIGG